MRRQRALQVLVATQAHCAAAFGYTPNGEGVMLFRQHLSECVRGAEREVVVELQGLDKDVWNEVLLRGFALEPKELPVDVARAFTQEVASYLSSAPSDANDDLRRCVEAIPADAQNRPMVALQMAQKAIAEAQLRAAPAFGYEGDAGFVQIQAGLVQHMSDPIVIGSSAASMHAVCQRAGIPSPF